MTGLVLQTGPTGLCQMSGIAGPVTHASIFDGEEYDARILPGYVTREMLGRPEINTEFTGRILPSEGAEIYFRHDLTLYPVKAYVWEDIEGESGEAYGKIIVKREYKAGETMVVRPGENLVIDFGQNCSAVPSFVFNAPKGTVMECFPAELLNDGNGSKARGMDGPEGSVHRLNLRVPDSGMKLRYTFANQEKDAGMMRDMAKATGRDTSCYEVMLSDAKRYIKERFLTTDGKFRTEILNEMQTPILFALKNGIVEGCEKEAMISSLRDNFARHDNCLQTGFLGTSILMPTLTENGMSDIAWELLFQRKNPSWLYSVDNGATTIWERWNSYMIDKGMGPQGMNSFNHYAYGVVCEWIWETAAGIASDPLCPGFRHIVMKPVPELIISYIESGNFYL